MTTNEDFQERVRRIRENRTRKGSTIYVGIDESYAMPRRDALPIRRPRGAELGARILHSLALAFGTAFGLAAVVAARAARFHIAPTLATTPDSAMLIDGGAALALAIVLALIFGLRSRQSLAGLTVGTGAMLCTFQDFVHWQPKVFAALFSPDWVQHLIATTPANSLMVHGLVLVV